MKRLLGQAVGFSTSLIICASSLMANPLASYKGGQVTQEEFKSSLEALGPQKEMLKNDENMRLQYVQHLIDLRLLAEQGQAAKLETSSEYRAIMEATQREVLAKLYIDRYLAEQTSPDKLKKYFNDNKKEFSAKEVQLSHILFEKDNQAEANKVLAEARKRGSDFNALITKYADDPSGAKGGDLGFITEGTVIPAIDQAAFNTPKGQVHPKLVETDFGLHIIKVTDVRGGDQVKFEDKKAEVEQIVRSKAGEQLVERLREQANIQINEESIKALQL